MFLYTLEPQLIFLYLGRSILYMPGAVTNNDISLSLLVPGQSQIAGQGKFPSTCFAYNTAGDQFSQNTQTSGASLTESGKTTLQFIYYAKCT